MLEFDTIIIQDVFLPTEFACEACGLRLDSHAKLDVAGLGGQYRIEEKHDPVSFYGGDPGEDEYEYGND